MALRSELEQATARIRQRSRTMRTEYMARVTRAHEKGPHRATLSCGNLAHDDRAGPHPRRQRIVIDAHGARAIALIFAEHDVEIAEARRANRRLGRRLSLNGIEAPFRVETCKFVAIAADDELAALGAVVGTICRADALKLDAVAADIGRLARPHGTGINAAICCGQYLVEAKRLVPHGRWTEWLEQHRAVLRFAARQSEK